MLYSKDLFTQLAEQNATILLDTNVFSTAARSIDFSTFLSELKAKTGVSFATVQAVLFETTQGSSTIEIYNQRAGFVSLFIDTMLPTQFIEKIPDFSVFMAKVNALNKSFTDFQLAACLYYYRHTNIYFLSSDQKALPTFFDRPYIMTAVQNKGGLVNFGVYTFNEANYAKALKSTQ